LPDFAPDLATTPALRLIRSAVPVDGAISARRVAAT
jgi:hypothetical protein